MSRARRACIAAPSSSDMFVTHTKTPSFAARVSRGHIVPLRTDLSARGTLAGISMIISLREPTVVASRGFFRTRAIARTMRAAGETGRKPHALDFAMPRSRVLSSSPRATSPAPSSRPFGPFVRRQPTYSSPVVHHPKVGREIAKLPYEPEDTSNVTDEKYSPETAKKNITVRSLEESLESQAVQRALANSVANALANINVLSPRGVSSGNAHDLPLSREESDAIGKNVVLTLRAHTRGRRVARQVEYIFVRFALAATNAFVLFGVCASLALSALLFTMGFREVCFDAVAAWIRFSPVELVTAAVGALDRFLLGMVCVIFGVGAFEVFLARVKTEKGALEPRNAFLRRLRWLDINSVDDLEQQVSGIVVAVLVVNILELSLHMTFKSPVDLVFASLAPLACAGALALLHISAGVEHGGGHKKKGMKSRHSKKTEDRETDHVEMAVSDSDAAAAAR